jgi:predicted DNA-binding transcriptional regulator AlpA
MPSHPGAPSPDRVVTRNEATGILSLSGPTLDRKRRDGSGPRFVRLSERRIGYRLSDLYAWLESRAGGGPRAAGQ